VFRENTKLVLKKLHKKITKTRKIKRRKNEYKSKSRKLTRGL
jgi:hypothetical protein